MSQFITVQVGQCGNQIGSAFWPLVLEEYGIEKTSHEHMNWHKIQRDWTAQTADLFNAFHSFFYVPDSVDTICCNGLPNQNVAKVKARAIMIDMEDSVVSRFKQGPLRELFDQTCIVTNYPGSGNNWAVGYHTHGKEYHDRLENIIRQTVEKCNKLHGFLLMQSLGGGTGSGLGTATLELLHDNYPHINRIVSCVYPTGNEDVITAPYNVLLATQKIIEHATCAFPIDNKALLEICSAQIYNKNNLREKQDFSYKPYEDMNSIIVDMLLHLTSGSRFPGNLNVDMNELATNLVPYSSLHFILSSISPTALSGTIKSTTCRRRLQDELFTNVWSRNNQLVKVDPMQTGSVILGSAYVARGQLSLTDLKQNIERLQAKARYTVWSKETVKVGMCSIPPAGHPFSLLCLLNSSAMSSMFKTIIDQFTLLYRRKAHVHHYTQIHNFEESDFSSSKECLMNLCEKYTQIQNQRPINTRRLHLI